MSYDVWYALNSLCRLGIMVIVMWKLVKFFDLFNLFERVGMAVGAAGAFLTVPGIWQFPNPFDGWAGFAFSFGIFLYFVGRSSRHFRHARIQRQQLAIAAAHFRDKVKDSRWMGGRA